VTANTATLPDADAPSAAPTASPRPRSRIDWPRFVMPFAIGVLSLLAWELAVQIREVPSYVLPAPSLIWTTLLRDWGTLSVSLGITLQITFAALVVAAVAGVGLSILFATSKWIEMSLFPYAVVLQVTPIVAIAPLIIIWVDDIRVALLVMAWIVAFFPILSNTTLGLNSTDHNLVDLFKLYRASPMQTLFRLRLPNAMPFFLAGLRISGGLALIGAIVAEFVAGTGGRASGLAYRILESSYNLQIPRMFAALLLICATGVAIFLVLSWVQYLVLRKWHESALKREV